MFLSVDSIFNLRSVILHSAHFKLQQASVYTSYPIKHTGLNFVTDLHRDVTRHGVGISDIEAQQHSGTTHHVVASLSGMT